MEKILNKITYLFYKVTRLGHEFKFLFNKKQSNTYYIVRRIMKWGNAGFFSNYLYAISHITYAKEKGYIPVVDMQNFKTLYSEKKTIYGTKNVWEYYFSNAGTSVKEAYASKNFILSDGYHPKSQYKLFSETNDTCDIKKDIYKKTVSLSNEYYKINDLLINKFEKLNEELFKGKTVCGIHYRGTDKKTPPPGHRYTPDTSKFVSAINYIIKKYNIDTFFICTDENDFIENISREFKEKTFLSTKSFRLSSTDQTGVHYAKPSNARENHYYLLGEEVLCDTYLLSKCSYLICGHSNVTVAAMFMNGDTYKEKVIIDSGDAKK